MVASVAGRVVGSRPRAVAGSPVQPIERVLAIHVPPVWAPGPGHLIRWSGGQVAGWTGRSPALSWVAFETFSRHRAWRIVAEPMSARGRYVARRLLVPTPGVGAGNSVGVLERLDPEEGRLR